MMKTKPTSPSFISAVSASLALLLGFGVLMLGDGLQSTLLAVRGFQEGFATTTIGFVMAVFYAGFLFGSLITPKTVARVGHIRVFAALAAVASAAILIHAVFVTPVVWAILRLISGFCFAGIYVVAESWLNDRASNETRGKILSLYMVITYMAVGISQVFLTLSDPKDYPLFVLTSVLISIAVVPLLMSAGPTPRFEVSDTVRLKELIGQSPLGVVGIFGVGMAMAALFSLGPVYASRISFTTAEISYFMAAPVFTTVLLQWPIGHWSDKRDRRHVLTVVAILAALSAVACLTAGYGPNYVVIATFGLFGGFSLPMYSLCIAHTNDCLKPEQMVAASGGLVLAGGLGAALGPLAASLMMKMWDDKGFFLLLTGIHAAIGVYGIYRMFKRRSLPLSEQGHHAPAIFRPTAGAVEAIQEHLRDDFPESE